MITMFHFIVVHSTFFASIVRYWSYFYKRITYFTKKTNAKNIPMSSVRSVVAMRAVRYAGWWTDCRVSVHFPTNCVWRNNLSQPGGDKQYIYLLLTVWRTVQQAVSHRNIYIYIVYIYLCVCVCALEWRRPRQ